MSRRLEEHGYDVYSSDLVYRGYGDKESFNFLEETLEDFNGDIITNPPYKYCAEFIVRALESIKPGNKVAMFLKLQTLESQKRYNMVFKDNPPKVLYVYVGRRGCAKNGEFGKYSDSAVAYAWFVWVKGFKGDPIIKWIV